MNILTNIEIDELSLVVDGQPAMAGALATIAKSVKDSPKMTENHTAKIEAIAKSTGTTFEKAFVEYMAANPSAYDTMSKVKPVVKAAAPALETSEFDRWYEDQINARVEKWNESRQQAVAKLQETSEFQQRYGQDQLLKAQQAGRSIGLSY